NELAEEHHIGLERAAAYSAARQHHPIDRLDLDVPVRTGLHGIRIAEPGVLAGHAVGDVGAREALPADEAGDAAHGAVQLDDAPGAGPGVQPVDVLRDDARDDAARFELGD